MKKKSGARTALKVLCVVLGLMLTVLLAGTIYVSHMWGMVNHVNRGQEETLTQEQIDQLLAEDTVGSDGTQAPVMDENEVNWGSETGELLENSDEIINILLIGQDARSNGYRARSDSMILVTFNKDKKTITMTSFLRDLYVKIPGYMDNKMNASYAFGGMELLNQTLEVNFGIQVDGNVEVNFTRFAEVIDLLGGVDMELRADEAAWINRSAPGSDLVAGVQHLNGEQALQYSRIRSLDADADFSRTNRQRKVINAVIEKFRNTSLTTLLGILPDLLPMITTDMSMEDILGYAYEFFPILSESTIISQRIPADGAYSLATIREMACVVADMDAARQLLKDTIGD